MSAAGEWPYPVTEFKCHMCGNCCRGDGFVEMTHADIERAADHLDMNPDQFKELYCEFDRVSKAWHLIDQDDDEKSCIFLQKDNGCRIHKAKPQQCEDFPRKWRPSNIMDFCEGWRAAAGLPPAKRKNTMSE